MDSRSCSFRHDKGSIEHNARRLKGRGIRQNGIISRREWNECLIELDIDETIKERVMNGLNEYNERMIKTRHSNRIKTFEKWKQENLYTRKGKQKQLIHEYIIQVGDHIDGCCYEYETDKNGNILNEKGEILNRIDTRQNPKPKLKNGKEVPSQRLKLLSKIYKDIIKEFEKQNPNAKVVGAWIHNDERAGSHLHLDVIWYSKTSTVAKVGLGYTTAIMQQLDDLGVKYDVDSQTKNATAIWTAMMHNILIPNVMKKYGIERKFVNEPKHPYYKADKYGEYADARSEVLVNKQNELNNKEKQLKEYERQLKKQKQELDEYELALEAQGQALLKQAENQGNKQAKTIQQAADKLKSIAKELAEKDNRLRNKETELNNRETEMNERETEIIKTEKNFKEKEKRVSEERKTKSELLKKKEKSLLNKETELKNKELALNELKDKYETVIEAGSNKIKNYYINYYETLKQHKEFYEEIRNEVIEKFGKQKDNKQLTKLEL